MDPLQPEDWPASLDLVRKALGQPLNVYNVMAHHPALLAAWLPLRQHILRASTLSERQRELAVLRTAVNTDTEYEWRHHVVRGRKAGLGDQEIAHVRDDPNRGAWTRAEELLLQAVDDLNHNFKISEPVGEELASYLSQEQLLDLIGTVGMYMTLACIIKSLDVPLEAELRPPVRS